MGRFFWWKTEEERKGNILHQKLHYITKVAYCNLHYIMVRLPFCFILWIFKHNTAVTTPNTVTVTTHSATKEAVVVVKTPGEGVQRCTPLTTCHVTTTQATVTCVNWSIKQTYVNACTKKHSHSLGAHHCLLLVHDQ